MRRTIRKTFLLEGETVTMKYVKQHLRRGTLRPHDRGREEEVLCRPHHRPLLSHARRLPGHLVSAGLTLWNRRRRAAFSASASSVIATFALCRAMCLRAAPCCFQIQPRRTALRGAGKPQGVIGLKALHGASGRDELPPRF